MSTTASDRTPSTSPQPLKRRGLIVGVGAAGAAFVAAKALPGVAPIATDTVAAKVAVDTGGGYQATPHVLHYYDTART